MSNILTLFAASDNRARHHQARIPVSALPNFRREVRLTVRAEGLPGTDNFEIVAAPLPVPKEDEALIRNLYFVVSDSLRMMMGGRVRRRGAVSAPAWGRCAGGRSPGRGRLGSRRQRSVAGRPGSAFFR